MKEIWLKTRDLIGKYGLPKTVQGIIYKANAENWQKRKISGIKGRVFEYEVSEIIHRYNAIAQYEADKNKIIDDTVALMVADDDHVTIPNISFYIAPQTALNSDDVDIRESFVLSKYWLALQGFNSDKLAIVRATSATMSPTINEGDVVLLRIHSHENDEAVKDGIYLLKISDSYVLYRLQYDLDKSIVHLISDNKAFKSFKLSHDELIKKIEIIAKAEMVLTKLD